MKAYVVKAGSTSLDGLQLVVRDKPTAGPGQILVAVKATSLNYRDLMVTLGRYLGGPLKNDAIALSDGAGEVVEVGSGVSRFKVGDRVAGTFFRHWIGGQPASDRGPALGAEVDGMLAEYVALHEDDAVSVPANLNYEEAATLPCAGVTAWHAMFEAGRPIRPGDTVLALGTGGVSSFAILLGRAAGARVVVTSSSDEKLELARKLGATDLINYRSHPEWEKEVLKATDKRGVDCVVEVGGIGTLARSMASLAPGGKVCMIGVLTEDGEANPQQVMRSGGQLHGIFVGSRMMFESLNRAVESNDLHPLVNKVVDFDDAVEAYRLLQSQAHTGKIVIRL